MPRPYKVQKIGDSYYLCLPPSFFTNPMLKKLVGVRVTLIEKGDDYAIVRLEEEAFDAVRKHDKDIKTSGENPPKSRSPINLREVG